MPDLQCFFNKDARLTAAICLYERCARASSGPLQVVRVLRATRHDDGAGALPCPDMVVVDARRAALACYADGRPVIVHPTLADLLAMHALHDADLTAAA